MTIRSETGTRVLADLLERYAVTDHQNDPPLTELLHDSATRLREFAAFVGTTARLFKDGEQDSDGKTFDMPNDDAVETLHGLISDARELLGIPDRPDGDGEELTEKPVDR